MRTKFEKTIYKKMKANRALPTEEEKKNESFSMFCSKSVILKEFRVAIRDHCHIIGK